MLDTPLVSVICISMNHEQFVEKSFGSLINQTYPNIEILYVDNNSHDASYEVSDALFKKSGLPYISLKREKNYGICANINVLLVQAKGKYITLQSGDDWCALNNLEEKIKYYEQHPEIGLLYTNRYYHYYDIDKIVPAKETKTHKSGWIFKDLLKGNFINIIGAVVKKEVYDEVGLYDENSPMEDWDMSLRIAQKYPIGYLNKRLVYYGHFKKGNISSNLTFMEKAHQYIFEKYAQYPEIEHAKRKLTLFKADYYASNFPGFKTLRFLLKHFQFNYVYCKQVIKCLLGIISFKKSKQT